jgi:hypothetical protein
MLAASAPGARGAPLAAVGLVPHREPLPVVTHPLLFRHTAVGAGLLVIAIGGVGITPRFRLILHFCSPFMPVIHQAQSLARHSPWFK